MELTQKQIVAATEELTKVMVKIVGVLNGVIVEDSDMDEEMVNMLAMQIRVNAEPAVQYAKARLEDGYDTRQHETNDSKSGAYY